MARDSCCCPQRAWANRSSRASWGRPRPPYPALNEAVTEYVHQARDHARGVRNFYVSTIVFLLLSGSVGVTWAVRTATSPASLRTSENIVYVALGVIFLICAAYSTFQAGRLRRLHEESSRLGRQLQYLNAYLAPLPKPTQDLIRGTLTQRLFPRALADNDPLREPAWPTPADLLASFSPELADVLASEGEGAGDQFGVSHQSHGLIRRLLSGLS